MGKFSDEEISKILRKALDSDDADAPAAKTDNSAIDGLSKKFDKLVDVISKMIPAEKPKSIEETVAEVVANAIAKANPPKEQPKKLGDMTSVEFCDMFGKSIAESLGKVIKVEKPKGEGKNDVEDVLDEVGKALGVDEDEADDDEADEDEKPKSKKTGKETKIDTVEATDKDGREIPLEKRVKMQVLDDFIGNQLNDRFRTLKKNEE